MSKQVSIPILITWDVDPDEWIPEELRRWSLNTAMDICQEQQIPATFFITAKGSELYRDDLDKLWSQGHEIGCHGFTHGTEENYDRMPEAQQADYIGQATEKLHQLTGRSIQAFRSPRVKTSATTLNLLPKYGYLSDSSVCSQRMDLISSNLINVGWLYSPRQPYRPHPNNAFKAGEVPLWEIPVSAAIIPFISTVMLVFGLSTMKNLFRLLYAESRRTGKPIVYLAHPAEFAPREKRTMQQKLKRAFDLKHLSPTYIRAHGLRLRDLLYRMDKKEVLPSTQALFAYMASFPGVEFMNVTNYTQTYLGAIPYSENGSSSGQEHS